jgi:hypothetical protein
MDHFAAWLRYALTKNCIGRFLGTVYQETEKSLVSGNIIVNYDFQTDGIRRPHRKCIHKQILSKQKTFKE